MLRDKSQLTTDSKFWILGDFFLYFKTKSGFLQRTDLSKNWSEKLKVLQFLVFFSSFLGQVKQSNSKIDLFFRTPPKTVSKKAKKPQSAQFEALQKWSASKMGFLGPQKVKCFKNGFLGPQKVKCFKNGFLGPQKVKCFKNGFLGLQKCLLT